jgi:hypothetical protein
MGSRNILHSDDQQFFFAKTPVITPMYFFAGKVMAMQGLISPLDHCLLADQ